MLLIAVCTDAVVFDLNVTDANVVMHYGMAKSKTTFGNRMSCAQESYRKSANLKDVSRFPSLKCGHIDWLGGGVRI